jgi:hypothetical protein
VGQELRRALEAPGAWTARRRGAGPAGLALTAEADRLLGRGELVDPYGSLTVRQRVVPLNITIDRFERIPLAAPQRWDLVDGMLGDRPAPSGEEARDHFAAAEYLALSDDQQFSRPSFEHYKSGIELTGGGVAVAPVVGHTIGFETKVFVGDVEPPALVDFSLLHAMELLRATAAPRLTDPLWWPAAEETARVEVAAEPPMTVVSTWSMTETSTPTTGHTTAELHDSLAGRPGLMVIEAWEVTG